jgi:cytoskeletal protein CcmA (bactofilin family)
MLESLRRKNRSAEANAPLKPALYEAPGRLAQPAPGTATQASFPTAPRENLPIAGSAPQGEMPNPTATAVPAPKPQSAGGKLSIGVNIKVKGVEISDCDVMVIEGHVEATVHSQVMEIAKPGTLMGTAMIDVAEIHGDFSGELTARTRLVVHGTGRVSGIIRYGKLVVAEGGELNGDVRQLDAADTPTLPLRHAAPGAPIASGTSDERALR